MRIVDGGTEFFKLNALANCFFLAGQRTLVDNGTYVQSRHITNRRHLISPAAPAARRGFLEV